MSGPSVAVFLPLTVLELACFVLCARTTRTIHTPALAEEARFLTRVTGVCLALSVCMLIWALS